jgi:hypothetical protein
VKTEENGGLIWIVLLIRNLAAPDQSLAPFNKVIGRGLLKVLRTKRALKGCLIVAIASGADGH